MGYRPIPAPYGWAWTPLRFLAERVSVGFVGPTREFFCDDTVGVPLVRSQNIRPGRLVLDDVAFVSKDFHRSNPKSQIKVGDVLITRVGANAGDVCMVPEDLGELHLSSAVFIRPKAPHHKWVEVFFRSPVGQTILRSRIVGSVSERINTKDVEALDVLLPPPSEQRIAAELLTALDDKIEVNRRVAATLEEMARALFKSWFVDFDPVQAKAEGREPGLPREIADLFPDRLVDSPLGLTPAGWDAATIGTIAKNVRDSATPAEMGTSTGYIGLEHMPRGSMALDSWGNAGDLQSVKSRFVAGDILFGKLRPYFKKVGVAPISGVCSTDILVIRPRAGWLAYTVGLASSDQFVDFASSSAGGTRMPRTSWSDLDRYAFAAPPIKLAQRFDGAVRPWLDQLLDLGHQQRVLAELRDALLPKLVSGEIRISDPEDFLARMEAVG